MYRVHIFREHLTRKGTENIFYYTGFSQTSRINLEGRERIILMHITLRRKHAIVNLNDILQFPSIQRIFTEMRMNIDRQTIK